MGMQGYCCMDCTVNYDKDFSRISIREIWIQVGGAKL
jgi:hypothetical protein